MAIIRVGKIDKNMIPILVGCIFCFANRLLNQYDGTLLFKNPIITNIFISISKLFTIIPFIILKRRTNRIYNTDIQSMKGANNFKYIYTNKQKIIVKGKWKFLLLSAIIFFIQSIIFVYAFKIKTNAWIWNILITSIFYYWIFKIKLYKHHYLSIFLIILIGFIIDIVTDNFKNDITNDLTFLLFRFIREILYSFHDVIDKYIMEKKFCSIYEISLSNGVITLILLGIFTIFDYYYFGLDDYNKYFTEFNLKEFLVVIGVMISQLGLFLSLLMTNKNNSPCHIFIIFVFGQLAYYIDFSSNSIIIIICLIFILFISLIFNEIIEINIFGLSDNTKRNISFRAANEDTALYNNNEDNEDFENMTIGNEENKYYLVEQNILNDEPDEEGIKNRNIN